jgi:hypothetical protein
MCDLSVNVGTATSRLIVQRFSSAKLGCSAFTKKAQDRAEHIFEKLFS